ncbi:MAG TPA: PEP-CTERM sorting domain-containing protein [Terriglobales bacterium]|nr:PEP-CTERM sorting domain-containing protein [Terriglobales bacterium]
MKNFIRTGLLVLAANGIASAGSFTIESVPPSALRGLAATPSAHTSYLTSPHHNLFASAAAKTKEGYIGTVRLDDGYSFTISNSSPSPVPVPEPATLVLLASGMAVAALRRRHRA